MNFINLKLAGVTCSKEVFRFAKSFGILEMSKIHLEKYREGRIQPWMVEFENPEAVLAERVEVAQGFALRRLAELNATLLKKEGVVICQIPVEQEKIDILFEKFSRFSAK